MKKENIKSIMSSVIYYSSKRFFWEIIPLTILYLLLWFIFHKCNLNIGTANCPEIQIHLVAELFITILLSIFMELEINGRVYGPTKKTEKTANIISFFLYATVIFTIMCLFLFKCKSWLYYC